MRVRQPRKSSADTSPAANRRRARSVAWSFDPASPAQAAAVPRVCTFTSGNSLHRSVHRRAGKSGPLVVSQLALEGAGLWTGQGEMVLARNRTGRPRARTRPSRIPCKAFHQLHAALVAADPLRKLSATRSGGPHGEPTPMTCAR